MQQIRGGIEDTRLEARTQKIPEIKAKDRVSRTVPLKAKDRYARGQEPRKKRASFLKKKKKEKGLLAIFPRNFRRSPKKRSSAKYRKFSAKFQANKKRSSP